jgi:broad specificity polyphosphatase/5'/3'-nucleotidase SurE
MALIKVQSEGINLADNFTFSGTVAGAGGGKVLQVIQATNTTLFSSSSGSMTATGKTVSIIPSSTSSKIFLTFSYVIRKNVDDKIKSQKK